MKMRPMRAVLESFPSRPPTGVGSWLQRCSELPGSPEGSNCLCQGGHSRAVDDYLRGGVKHPGHAGALPVPASAAAVVAGSGSPLEPGVRALMQDGMGHDFARVRVHTDASAARSAHALGALAYTVGEHIAFRAGRYAPGTHAGQRLLAHELTHVTQQRSGLLCQSADPDLAPGNRLETEARAAARALTQESDTGTEYDDEPGLDGELPHPDHTELAEIAGALAEVESLGVSDALTLTTSGSESAYGAASDATAGKTPLAGKTDQVKKTEKRIVVNLDKQTATAMEDGKPVKTMPISSGKPGHRTSEGHFTINERDLDHKSSKYGRCVEKSGSRDVSEGADACKKGEKYYGAPMPYFQRFHGAEGFHQGKLPGHPDSHGCVRLSRDNAKWLWDWADENTNVDVGSAKTRKRARSKRP